MAQYFSRSLWELGLMVRHYHLVPMLFKTRPVYQSIREDLHLLKTDLLVGNARQSSWLDSSITPLLSQGRNKLPCTPDACDPGPVIYLISLVAYQCMILLC